MARSFHAPNGDPCFRCGKAALSHRVDHIPKGDPCSSCGLPVANHRVDHTPLGDPCIKCGVAAVRHRNQEGRSTSYATQEEPRKRKRRTIEKVYCGIDGEGYGRKNHNYVFLAAVSEYGRTKYIEDHSGLPTWQCLEFILELPKEFQLFGFAFGYDLTKMLQDIDNKTLYYLAHQNMRQRPPGPKQGAGPYPVRWRDYDLNLQGSKFTVTRDGVTKTIWDTFKFYQSSFVNALKAWKVGNPELWTRMQAMKDNRADFDALYRDSFEKVREYCFEECKMMALLTRKLVEAHAAVGLKLTKFYGAGSTGSLVLEAMGIKEQLRPTPPMMRLEVASAFYGGRFENSVIGKVDGPVYSFDISSAYPYHMTFLPCFLHGEWEKTTRRDRIEGRNVTAALVRYTLEKSKKPLAWGPFPFRIGEGKEKGSTCYPIESGGGWVWRDEYVQGEKLFPNVKFQEAWIYTSKCTCQPFAKIPEYYAERVRIGKEGPGIVLKLGINSGFGKLAQSVGNAPFNSWVWAGMITSGCRAQMLHVMSLHDDTSNILMIATDGIYTREDPPMPLPRETGTGHCMKDGKPIPLGGWERKVLKQGVFAARPGIYWPLNPTQEEKDSVRARGLGRAIIFENHTKIEEFYERYGVEQKVPIEKVSRFCGMKTSIRRTGEKGRWEYVRADGMGSIDGHQMPNYGQWIERPTDLSFNPLPKRARVLKDGSTLEPRRMVGLESAPYHKAVISQEAKELSEAYEMMLEQPDWNIKGYDSVDEGLRVGLE